MYFTQLPEIVNRFLMPPDPVALHYMINPATAPPERPTAWDVEVKLEDLALKHRMKSVTLDANQATLKTLGDIDEEVGCAISHLVNAISHTLTDRSAHSIIAQLGHEVHVPPLVLTGARGIHSNVVSLSVSGPGDRPGKWDLGWCDD